MRDRDSKQLKENNALLERLGIVDTLRLKRRFTINVKCKFGGKKKSAGNSGKTGRAYMRKSRACVVSQANSPLQYGMYMNSVKFSKKDKGAQKLTGESKS